MDAQRDALFLHLAIEAGLTPQPAGNTGDSRRRLREAGVPEARLAELDRLVEAHIARAGSAAAAVAAFEATLTPAREPVLHLASDALAAAEDELATLDSGPAPTETPRTAALRNANSEDADLVSAEQPGRYTSPGNTGEVEIGRGGLGRVLVAMDAHLQRQVAVKELLVQRGPADAGTAAFVTRFLREARVTARLEHPNIVPVYEVGRRADGRLYYTMKLVKGRTLHDALKECESLRERLKLLPHVVDLCQAIAYAHSRGVIHRDIKPHNVMVGEFGETVVLDWGLAKLKDRRDVQGHELQREVEALKNEEDSAKTVAGRALGTPAYMSPEQAEGRIDDIDARSDVWSLGAVLYETLTGRPPYTGRNGLQIVMNVLLEPLVPVRKECPEAPAELAAIAERALTKDKDGRYASAREMGEDIQAYLVGGDVSAHAYSTLDVVRRFAKKHRGALVAAVAGLGVAASLGVVGHLRVLDERDRAVLAEKAGRRALSEALVEKARSAARDADWTEARAFSAAALSLAETPQARGWAVAGASSFIPELRAQIRTGRGCAAIRYAADGSRLFCAGNLGVLAIEADGAQDPKRLAFDGGWVRALDVSVDGRFLAYAGDAASISVVDLAGSGDVTALPTGLSRIDALAWGPGGRLAAAGQGKLLVFDVDGTSRFLETDGEIVGLAFSPGGLLALLRRDGVLDVRGGNGDGASWMPVSGGEGFTAFAFGAKGGLLATAGVDRTLRLWNVAEKREISSIRLDRPARALAFSADDKVLVAGDASGAVSLRNARTLAPLQELRGPSATAMALSPTGARLAAGGEDAPLRLWDLLPSAQPAVRHLATRQDATGLAHLAADVLVVASGTTLQGFHRSDGTAAFDDELGGRALTFAADPAGAVAVGTDDAVLLFDAAGKVTHRFAPGGTSMSLAVHGGKVAAVVRGQGLVLLEGDAPPRALPGHGTRVDALAFAPDGSFLASGGADHAVRLWDPATGTEIRRFEGHDAAVRALAVSPDAHFVAAADGRDVRVWDANTGASAGHFVGHDDAVLALAFSPSGELLASAGADRTVRVWRAASGREVARFDELDGEIRAVSFSPDGRELTAAATGRSIAGWSLDHLARPADELLSDALHRSGLVLDGTRLVPDLAWNESKFARKSR